jgi:hypothetical protein
MTDADRLLDRLLAEDGARWRAAQPPPPDAAVPAPPPRPHWQPIAAAAAVVALTAGIVAVVAVRRPADPPPAGPPPTTAGTYDIVRDGDRVAGQGLFFAPSGRRPVRLCGPLGGPPRPQIEPWPDPLNTPGMCQTR